MRPKQRLATATTDTPAHTTSSWLLCDDTPLGGIGTNLEIGSAVCQVGTGT